jgi:hypothetical protein
MKKNLDEELDRLFSAVRSLEPDTKAAEAYFETRLMASLEERQNSRALLQTWTWRFIPWFATFVIIIGIGTIVYDPMRSSDLFTQFTNGYEEFLMTTQLAGG